MHAGNGALYQLDAPVASGVGKPRRAFVLHPQNWLGLASLCYQRAVAVRIIDSQDFHPRPATPLAERSQHLLVPPFRSSPESYSSNAMILFFLRDLSPPAAL
jgi:hypothetical protein